MRPAVATLVAALVVVAPRALAQSSSAPPAAATATASSAPPAASSASPAPAASPAPSSAFPTAVVIDAFPAGVDAAAATFVTTTLRDALTQAGFPLVPVTQMYEAARRLAMPYPPPPEGVLALLRALAVPVAITCEVRGGNGYYQAIVRVRYAQEPTERIRQILATQWTLGASLRAALPSMLAAPTAASMAAYGPIPQAPPFAMAGYTPPPRRPATRLHESPWDVAIGTELALGPGDDAFFNVLAYVRVAYFPVDRFGITASLAYANLRGVNGRVNDLLPMIGIETAVDFIPTYHVYLPLRAEVGYLPFNGPVLRGTAGVGIRVSGYTRIELDLLTPTFWFNSGITPVSLDLGAQVVLGFGAPPPPPPRHHHHHHHSPAPGASESPEPASDSPAPDGASGSPRPASSDASDDYM